MHPVQPRPLEEWEKRAAWYNRGVINIAQAPLELQPQLRIDLDAYLWGTWKSIEPIRSLDLLGIESECLSSCKSLKRIVR
jgi:hypothetical protein